jgi:heptaprenyl diphosphate synthase
MPEISQATLRGHATLAALQTPVAEALAAVEQRLRAALAPAAGFLRPVLGQLSGGKRLRPLVLLLCARDERGTVPAAAVPVAGAVELVHLASLMHDDVLDGAGIRRGLPSVPAALGERRAVLAGDFLAAAAYLQVASSDPPEAGVKLSDAVVQMTLSEVAATFGAGQLLSEKAYLELIAGKTAALFAAAAELGGLAAGASDADLADFRAYGHDLGMAFQIRDDLLDLYGDPESLGKGTRCDLISGLYTLPVIYAAQAPGSQRLLELLGELGSAGEPDGRLDEIADLTRRLGGEARATKRMQEYAREACAALPACASHEVLCELARYTADRDR